MRAQRALQELLLERGLHRSTPTGISGTTASPAPVHGAYDKQVDGQYRLHTALAWSLQPGKR
jgi:hypothetical protein